MRTDELVFFVILILVAFVLPFYAGYLAFQRGKKTWALASILSAFLGVGWIAGFIVLLGVRNLPPTSLSANIQCPECKNTKVSTRMVIVDAKSGEEIYGLSFIIFVGGLFAIVGLFFVYTGLYGLTTPPSTSSVTVVWTLFDVPVSEEVIDLLFVAFGLGIIGSLIPRGVAYFRASKVRILKHTCNSCKHSWQEALQPTTAQPSTPIKEV